MLISQLFKTKYPLIQAPMAGAQDSALCIAVSQAGGLGSLPCAMLSSEQIEGEVTKFRKECDKPISLNFFCHEAHSFSPEKENAWRKILQPYYEEYNIEVPDLIARPGRRPFDEDSLNLVKALKPEVISFHFGLPEAALWDGVKSTGAKIISSATTLEEALYLEEAGVDGIIAQGLEAGGHRGHFLQKNTSGQKLSLDLLAEFIPALKTPIILAGGLANKSAIKTALEMGAAGVQVGTAYLLCNESRISTLHRLALKGGELKETSLTNLFSGRPARGLINRLMQEQGPMNTQIPAFPMAGAATQPLRKAAEADNHTDFTPLWSGMNNDNCQEISAQEITLSLFAD